MYANFRACRLTLNNKMFQKDRDREDPVKKGLLATVKMSLPNKIQIIDRWKC